MVRKKFVTRTASGVLASVLAGTTIAPGISAAAETLRYDNTAWCPKNSTWYGKAISGPSGEYIRAEDNIIAFDIEGQSNWGLCLNPSLTSGLSNSDLNDYTTTYNSTWDATSAMKHAVGLAMYYGYPHYQGGKSSASADYYIATQMLVWELMLGIRDPKTLEFVEGQSHLYTKFNCTSETKQAYKDILGRMQKHGKIPARMFTTASEAKHYDSEKTVVFKYDFTTKNYKAGFNIGAGYIDGEENNFNNKIEDELNSMFPTGTVTMSTKKVTDSGSEYYHFDIVTDAPPVESGKILTSGIINANYSGLDNSSWMIFAVPSSDPNNPNYQTMATGAGQIDPAKGYLNFTSAEYGTLRIRKIFKNTDEAIPVETAEKYRDDVYFVVSTKINGVTNYVVAEQETDAATSSQNYSFKEFTTNPNNATHILLTKGKGKTFFSRIYNMPAPDSSDQEYVVTEFLTDPNSDAAKDHFEMYTEFGQKEKHAYIAAPGNLDDDTAASMTDADFVNQSAPNTASVELYKNYYDISGRTSSDENAYKNSKYVAFFYKNGTIYYLKDLNTFELNDNPTGVYTAGVTSSGTLDSSYYTTDPNQAMLLSTRFDDAGKGYLSIDELEENLKIGFIEIKSNDYNNNYGFKGDSLTKYEFNPDNISGALKTLLESSSAADGILEYSASAASHDVAGIPGVFSNNTTNGEKKQFLFTLSTAVQSGKSTSVDMDNYPYTFTIDVLKTDDNNSKLAGADVALYRIKQGVEVNDTNLEKLETKTSGSNGMINFTTKIPVISSSTEKYDYYYKEINAPTGFVKDSELHKVTIPSNISLTGSDTGATNYYLGTISQMVDKNIEGFEDQVLVNTPLKGDLDIIKTDDTTDLIMEGISFDIITNKAITAKQASEIQIVTGTVVTPIEAKAYAAGSTLCTIKTDAAGKIGIKDLPLGSYNSNTEQFANTYTVKETGAVAPYRNTVENTYTFSMDDLKNVNGTETLHIFDTVNNTPEYAKIRIKKTDDNTEHPTPLAGAVFTITADKDVIINGKTVQKAGVIGTLTTDATGYAANYTESNGATTYKFYLYSGFTYHIQETKAPDGYIAKEIGEEGKINTPYFEAANTPKTLEYTFTNTAKKFPIKLIKVGTDDERIQNEAVFTIYSDTNNDEKYNTGDTEYGKMTYNGNGEYSVESLPVGNYLVRETKAPDGFVGDDNYYPVHITTTSSTEPYIITNKNDGLFHNSPIEVQITVKKRDSETDEALPGAGFTIYYDKNGNGQLDSEDTEYKKMPEISTGNFKLEKVPYGHYLVKETKVPDKYKGDDKYYPVNATINGHEYVVSNAKDYSKTTDFFYNTPRQGQVTLVKTDEEGNVLSGATFKIYRDGNNDGKYNADTDEDLGNLTEKSAGNYVSGDLNRGHYLVREISAPTGYVADPNYHPIEIKEVGETVKVTNDKENKFFKNTPIEGNVKLVKKDSKSSEILSGAVFAVYKDVDNDGKYTEGTDEELTKTLEYSASDKSYKLDNLVYGNYLVKETQAPEGYIGDNSYYPFAITENGKTVTIENAKEQDPGYFLNTPNEGTIELYKIDSKSKEILTDAEFHYYEDTNKNGEYDQDTDKDLGALTNDGKGRYYTGKVRFGTYFVKETKAPANHSIDKGVYTAKITKKDEVFVVSNTASGKFENTPESGKLVLEKVDKEHPDAKLSGATFTVYTDTDKDGKYTAGTDAKIGTMSEIAKGYYELKDLDIGTYFVEETEAPAGFLRDEKVYTAIIEKANQEVPVETTAGKGFENVPKKGSVSVIKYDKDTSEILSGAEFTLYEDSNNNGEFDDTDKSLSTLTETSAGSGKYVSGELRLGTYFVKETQAPDGYDADPNAYKAVITEDKQVINIENEVGRGFVNAPKKGTIKLTKIDEEYPDNKLSGAIFEVYRDENGNDVIDDGDTSMGTLTEGTGNSKGVYTMTGLRVGTYLVKETDAPDGFDLDENTYKAVITTDGQTVEIENEAGKGFANSPKKGSITLTKVNKNDPDDKLSGAIFEVYKDENDNGVIDDGDTSMGTLTEGTGDNKGVYTMSGLRIGTYLVKETKAPDEFNLDTNTYKAVIANDGDVITIENEIGKGFVNTPKSGTITLTKVDKEYPDNKLSGAIFEVYKDENGNGAIDEGDTSMGTLTEGTGDNKGVYTMSGLRIGTYLVKETKAPDEFNLDTNTYTAVIANDGDVITIENEAGKGFANSPKKGKITLTKYDSRYPDHVLTGATFELFEDTNQNGEYDEGDTSLGNLTEGTGDQIGTYSRDELRMGTYFVHETNAPEGFKLDNGYYKATLTEDKQVFVVTNRGDDTDFASGFYNDIKKAPVEITKTDIVTSEGLPNTGIRIYNSDMEVIFEGRTDENGKVTFEDLPYGSYFYQEFEAPEGYVLDDSLFEFKIVEDGVTVKAEMKDRLKKAPVIITKTDVTTSEALPNTGIRIYNSDKEVIREGRTDENGQVTFEDLTYGTYYFQEFEAPEGYVIDETLFEFKIEEDGVPVKAEMKNRLKKAPVEITKTDVTTSEALPNTGIRIYNSDMEVIREGRTDENGKVTFEDLTYGTYYFQEFEAPEGYVIDETLFEFKIEEDGVPVKAEMKDKPITNDVEITKTDVSTSAPLPNTGIRICDEDGTLIFEGHTDAEGIVRFKELRYGKYYFQEFEAPEGYQLNTEKHYFEVKTDGETIKATLTNEKIPQTPGTPTVSIPTTNVSYSTPSTPTPSTPSVSVSAPTPAPETPAASDTGFPVPQTGTDDNMVIPVAVGAGSALGLIAVTIATAKKRKRED